MYTYIWDSKTAQQLGWFGHTILQDAMVSSLVPVRVDEDALFSWRVDEQLRKTWAVE